MIALDGEPRKDGLFRILSLDGGGAKGFYTLGVLREIEGLTGQPLHECFDLVFGTSTGGIIAAMIALGYRVTTFMTFIRSMCRQSCRRKSRVIIASA